MQRGGSRESTEGREEGECRGEEGGRVQRGGRRESAEGRKEGVCRWGGRRKFAEGRKEGSLQRGGRRVFAEGGKEGVRSGVWLSAGQCLLSEVREGSQSVCPWGVCVFFKESFSSLRTDITTKHECFRGAVRVRV